MFNINSSLIKHTVGWGCRAYKAPKLHGINPSLIYEPAEKIVELPRFSTQEMLTAREMNKIAIKQPLKNE